MGRGCFELARHFDNVVGVDLSTRVIEVANKLKDNRYVCVYVCVSVWIGSIG